MKSREFEKIYHPSLGRYEYEHRGNGLIVNNIMKPLKGITSAAANKAGRAVAKAIGKKASKTAKAAAAKAEKSGDLIRKRLTQEGAPKNSSGDFRISASIDKVKYVFVYLQRDKTNDMTENPYIFDTLKLNAGDDNSTLLTCRLECGNGVFYPELDYDSDSKSRIFSDLMNYSWKKNDYNTGTQLNIANFTSIYPLIFFYLSYQAAQVSRDPKQVILKYRINTN